MKSVIATLKKPTIYIVLGVLALIIVAFFLVFRSKPVQREAVTVTKSDIAEEVFITGTVAASQSVSLSFDRGGIIKAPILAVGTRVTQGTIIASLKNESEYATVAESEALVAIAKAKLATILGGTRSEELRLKEAEVRKAEVSLENSKGDTGSILSKAYNAAEEALNRYADPFFSNDDTTAPRLTYSSGTQAAYDAETKRIRAGTNLSHLQTLLSAPTSSEILESALADLRVVQDLFVTLGLTLRDGSTLDTTTLADYRGRVTTARTALADAITLSQNQLSGLRSAEAELERAKRALLLASAGATPETITQAEQEVRQAEAKRQGSVASLEKTLLRAPFNGQISSKRVEIGETVPSGSPIVEFLGTGGFTIEANVPEADIAKLNLGDEAVVTLDAYGANVSFTARITEIEHSEKVIEGVSTYKTTFAFTRPDERLRSGMTANLTVTTARKAGVLVLPFRAIERKDGISTTTVLRGDGVQEAREITVGLRGSNGLVEIVSGLSEGEKVLMPTTK